MNPTDPSPKKSKSRKPKQPSTPSEPAERAVAPWELAEQMTEEQIGSSADELVKLFLKKEAQNAAQLPPATSSAVDKPKMTDEERRAALLRTKPRRENYRTEEVYEEALSY